MRRGLAAVLAVSAALAPAFARAQEEPMPIMVRVRPVYLSPSNKSDAIPALGVAADAIHVSSKAIPEVDVTWFFNPYLSAELVLTVPQEHDVTLNGTKLGTFSHLPPTLTMQAGLPIAFVRPYVGAGVNLTLITAQSLGVPGVGPLELSRTSVGFAGQAGVDFAVSSHWAFNLDVKYVKIGVDVKSAGTKVSEVHVDPWLFGGGLAYRF